jgi:uncharacterized membrane protein YcaP (DUF421 family)
LLTEDELRAQLREKEVVRYDEVQLATLEGDGRLSVIKVMNDSCSALVGRHATNV